MSALQNKFLQTIIIFGTFGPLIGGMISTAIIPISEDETLVYILIGILKVPIFFLAFFPITFLASYLFGLIPSLAAGLILWVIYRKRESSLHERLIVMMFVGGALTIPYALFINADLSIQGLTSVFTTEMAYFSWIPGSISGVMCTFFVRKKYLLLEF